MSLVDTVPADIVSFFKALLKIDESHIPFWKAHEHI